MKIVNVSRWHSLSQQSKDVSVKVSVSHPLPETDRQRYFSKSKCITSTTWNRQRCCSKAIGLYPLQNCLAVKESNPKQNVSAAVDGTTVSITQSITN